MTVIYLLYIGEKHQLNMKIAFHSLNPNTPGATSPNSLRSGTYQNIQPGEPKSYIIENGVQGIVLPKDPLVPKRPAPKPPTSYATISGYGGK